VVRVFWAARRHDELAAGVRRQRGARLVDEGVPEALSAFLDENLVIAVFGVVDRELGRTILSERVVGPGGGGALCGAPPAGSEAGAGVCAAGAS
jgi:hypothetical protein